MAYGEPSLKPGGNDLFCQAPEGLHLGMVGIFSGELFLVTAGVERAGTLAAFGGEQQTNGRVSPLTRRTDEGTEENIGQGVEPHVHGDNLS